MDIYALGMTLLSPTLTYMFGEADFKGVQLNGPYEVGFKEFTTKRRGNEVSVYYPITKEHHAENIGRKNTRWARHGDHTI
jgi:hypothetical protein